MKFKTLLIKLNKIQRALFIIMILTFFSILITGCSRSESANPDVNETQQQISSTQASKTDATTENNESSLVPIYKNAKILDESNFNTNHYSLLYTVNEDYETVLDFYMDAFELDSEYAGETDAYYEGFSYGDIFVNGLTIETVDDGVNVYITYKNEAMGNSAEADEEDENDFNYDSSILTYDTAQAQELDDAYPKNSVPLYSESKVIGGSFAPNGSGFIDLIIPYENFEDAVNFYEQEIGLEVSLDSSTSFQKAIQLIGEKDGYSLTVLISQLLGSKNDPYIQIVISKN